MDLSKLITKEMKAEKAEKDLLMVMTTAVQGYLDDQAKTLGYDSMLSMCSYATSSDPAFAAEAQAGVLFRDAVWRKCYQILEDVRSGNRPELNTDELLAELPLMMYP